MCIVFHVAFSTPPLYVISAASRQGKEGRFDVTRPIAHLRVLVELAKLQVRHLETWDECSSLDQLIC